MGDVAVMEIPVQGYRELYACAESLPMAAAVLAHWRRKWNMPHPDETVASRWVPQSSAWVALAESVGRPLGYTLAVMGGLLTVYAIWRIVA